MNYLLCFLFLTVPKQGIIVLILESHLVPQELGTHLELMTRWTTGAMETCFWWAPKKECARRTASGLVKHQNATVRMIPAHAVNALCHLLSQFLVLHFKYSYCVIYTIYSKASLVGLQ